MSVSKKSCTPKSSILILGYPYFLETPLSKNSPKMRLQNCGTTGTPGSGPSVDLASRSQVEAGWRERERDAAVPEKKQGSYTLED